MNQESTIRLVCFVGVFAIMAIWEVLARRRPRTTSTPARWAWNLGLALTDTVVLQMAGSIVLAGLAVGVAQMAEQRGWGILNYWQFPPWVGFTASVLLLDLAIYLQHVISHKVPIFWRLHKVHHTDRDLDVTSALRFHPVEILLSMGYKMAWVVALGAPPWAVLVFEVLLNGTAIFNHANARIPVAIDRVLRCFVVTPDMHRVHHSDWHRETDSNFGFNLPWWDMLFGTYRDAPRDGHLGMTLGLKEYSDPRKLHLGSLLTMPFLSRRGGKLTDPIHGLKE